MDAIDTSRPALAAVEFVDISNRGKRVGLDLLYDYTLSAGACDEARVAYARAARMHGVTATYLSLWFSATESVTNAEYFTASFRLVTAAGDEAVAARDVAGELHTVCLEQRDAA